MKRGWVLVAFLLVSIGAYWLGTDMLGLWLPVRLPWTAYQVESAAPELALVGVSQEQAAEQIFKAWLAGYKSRKIDPVLRLRDYRIDSITEFQRFTDGFVCMIEYHVKPYAKLPQAISPGMTLGQLRTGWVSGNGLVEEGWVKHKITFLFVKQDGDTYSMLDQGTCPPELLGTFPGK